MEYQKCIYNIAKWNFSICNNEKTGIYKKKKAAISKAD